MNRLVHLKIKIKTLAAESRFIKTEERKAVCREHKHDNPNTNKGYNPDHWWLYTHRISKVKPISRTNHLAYGALRGVSYSAMETKSSTEPDWSEIKKIALKFGGDPLKFDEWLIDAYCYYKKTQKEFVPKNMLGNPKVHLTYNRIKTRIVSDERL